MKTIKYNPSALEMDMANALMSMTKEIEKHLQDNTITEIDPDLDKENPVITFHLTDKDGDRHQLSVRIFQAHDKY